MELIFFYINQSSTKFIETQGFNFSPNYVFKVDCQDGKYVLRQERIKEKLPKRFFDSSNCISNITAIVGENGSGKTTLLNCLARYCGAVKEQTYDADYEAYFNEEYEKAKQIAIYCDAGKLICYSNIEEFENTTGIYCEHLYQGSYNLSEIVRNNTGFENISKISLSNSMYALAGGVGTHVSISEISLNVNSLKVIKDIFYDTKCSYIKSHIGSYCEYQDMLRKYKSITEFQQILDILYLQYIRKNKVDSIFANNINGKLTVNFQSFMKCLDDTFHEFDSERNKDNNLRPYFNMLKDKLLRFDIELLKEDIFCTLYINLLFELIVYMCGNNCYGVVIHGKKDLVEYTKSRIESLPSDKENYKQYFQDAFDEICKYEQCLKACNMEQCLLPPSDLGYISRKEIEYGSSAYDEFMGLIRKSAFESEYSFVLKYINIGGLTLASGERALLNFFSWMYLVPFFKKISNNVGASLRDNVLLLIDEIDLYCHPGWQQKLLKYLIEEVKAQYKGKSVQIIFTTHSPIVLSDMPKSNVIYLKRNGGKCFIDDSEKHTETFGANIYKLFDDAFFLGKRGQIGEFAKDKIQSIIDRIQPDLNKEGNTIYPELAPIEIEQLEKEISLIGEIIIRNKLYEMLFNCKYRSFDIREKKIKIYEEKIRKLQNGEDV